jgi:hypothetical protein
MKKFLSILSFVLFSSICHSQTLVQRSSAANTVGDNRLQATLNLFVPRYFDTTQANLSRGIDSSGALIYTYAPTGYWFRAHSPKRWVIVGSGLAPAQVNLIAGLNVTITGTYPNLTINAAGNDSAYVNMYSPNDSTLIFVRDNGGRDTINGGGGSGTSVTSVGLTMPSAFSVSGSPITSTGTFSVTGAGTTAQYIRGDGALATFPTGLVTSVSGTTNRITSTGGTTPVIDISSSYVGQSSITTLGTITTGIWNGTDIAFANIAQVGANTILANPTASTADISTVALSASQLIGRGSTGNIAPIVLGTNLSMSGATLNATGGGQNFGQVDTLFSANRYVNEAGYNFKWKNGTVVLGASDSVGNRLSYSWASNPVTSSVWTVSGTAPTTAGVHTVINGTTTLTSVIKTGVENWTATFTAITNTKSSVKQNVSFSFVPDTISAAVTRKVTFALSDTSGYINFFRNDGATTPLYSNRGTQQLYWAAADTFDFNIIYRARYVTATMTNRTNGQKSILKYEIGGSIGNVGVLKVINEGNFTYLGNLVYKIDEVARPKFVIVGNSTEAGSVTSYLEKRWENVLFENYNTSYVVHAGGGERAVHGIARIDEIVNVIRPEKVIYGYGVNDLNGGSIVLFSQNARRFADSMNAHGIQTIFMSLVPQASNVATYNDTIQAIATAKGGRYINITTTLQAGSVDVNKNDLYKPAADPIHLNDAGHQIQGNLVERGVRDLLTVRPSLTYDLSPVSSKFTYFLAKDENNQVVSVPDGISTKYILNRAAINLLTDAQDASIHIFGSITAQGITRFTGTGTLSNPNFSVNALSDGVTRISTIVSSNMATNGTGTFFTNGRNFYQGTVDNVAYQTDFKINKLYPNSGTAATVTIDNDNTGGIPSAGYKLLDIKENTVSRAWFDRKGGLHSDSTLVLPNIFSAPADTTTWKPMVVNSSGLVYKGYWLGGGGGGSGTNNANIGSGYRVLIPSTQEVKTLFAGTNITIDSTTNTNGLTIFASGGGSGTDNANVGSGYRIIIPSTQQAKTLFAGTNITIDSTTNTNGLTITASGGGSSVISALTAATATNDIDNLNFRQRWRWATLAGDTALVINSTSTAAASDAQVGFASLLKGANGTSGQFTVAMLGANTHTGTTSENIGVRGTASGGTDNYAGYFDNMVSIGGSNIAAGSSASHALTIRSLDNTAANGLIIYPNANYGTSTNYGYAGMIASADYFLSVVGGDLQFNSARTRFGDAGTTTAKIHIAAGSATAGTGQLKLDASTLVSTTEAGLIENNGTHLYYTAANSGTRFQLDQQTGGTVTSFTFTDGSGFDGTVTNSTTTPTLALTTTLSTGHVMVAGASGAITGSTGLIGGVSGGNYVLGVGVNGGTTGIVVLSGSTSGAVTIAPQNTAGTYNFNLPTSAGTSGQPLLSGGGGSTAQTYGTLGVGAGGLGITSTPSNGQIPIGNGTNYTAANITSSNSSISITNGSGTINIQTAVVTASGTYTPTATAVTNVAAITVNGTFQYMRVGDVVTVSGSLDIDPTAVGTTTLRFTLPVASGFATAYQLGGTGAANPGSAELNPAVLSSNASANEADMNFAAIGISSQTWWVHFTYSIVSE